MILKPALKSRRDIDELERIATKHPGSAARARQQIANIVKGHQGEDNAAHVLDRLFRSSTRTALLHDVRLDCGEGDFTQIDHLLINRVWATAWVLETKNYSGDLRCNEHGEWTAHYGARPVAIPSPIEQARRQVLAFKRWLKINSIASLRKVIPVVLVNPRTHLHRRNLRPDEHIIKSDNFGRWIDEQSDQLSVVQVLSMAARFAASGMSEQELRGLGSAICAADRPAGFDWELRLRIKPDAAAARVAPQSTSAAIREPAPDQTQAERPSIDEGPSRPVIPERIATPHGDITITSIGADFAVRNPPHADVIEVVKSACRGNGKWNGRYRNWLIPDNNIASVTAELRKHFR